MFQKEKNPRQICMSLQEENKIKVNLIPRVVRKYPKNQVQKN